MSTRKARRYHIGGASNAQSHRCASKADRACKAISEGYARQGRRGWRGLKPHIFGDTLAGSLQDKPALPFDAICPTVTSVEVKSILVPRLEPFLTEYLRR